ncbi:type VI secretion system baseplate subunit TssG [Escherichia coli :H19]|uniref:type VI secretion system baseplate subunit TssG n=1 Tax=Enterobacterales TaxID=91347 RepID=UPI000E356194|nr:type VI secretion system baseplate subunit TssG [Escherichia coli]EGJ4979475.1 type VI secretion system baseplate subunit TssG [Escherichia coli]EGJ6409947.1 type VI secretion system baseplate subunit TssG [Escherichia coli]RFQ16886.1 type VI secretion system baseplate subunit TssG [Escherichia coli]
MAMINIRNKFSFFRQIRILLAKVRKQNDSISEAVDKHFRFSSTLSLDAPDGQIEKITKDEKSGIYYFSVYDNGLTGATGILPVAYTEWLIERKIRYNDTAPKAFIDMFNHRMYCLSYLAWQKMRLPSDENKLEDSVLNNVLLSLAGISKNTLSLTGQAYTSLYAQSVRSLSGLEQLLSLLYQLTVNIHPFRGRHENVEQEEQGRLGYCKYSLRDGPVIGHVRWRVDSHFDVVLGPIDYERALKFMPGGPFHQRVRQQIRSYIGVTPEFTVIILVQPFETDNLLNSGKKLGLNISLGSGKANQKPRCFRITK